MEAVSGGNPRAEQLAKRILCRTGDWMRDAMGGFERPVRDLYSEVYALAAEALAEERSDARNEIRDQ